MSSCDRLSYSFIGGVELYTVDLVIFACLNFREFLILGLFTKFRIREFTFFFSNAITRIIVVSLLNPEFALLAKFVKIKTSRILPDPQYLVRNLCPLEVFFIRWAQI